MAALIPWLTERLSAVSGWIGCAPARLLAGPLRRGSLTRHRLDRVQLRRWAPTALTQAAQRAIHARVLVPVLTGEVEPAGSGSGRPPLPIRPARR